MKCSIFRRSSQRNTPMPPMSRIGPDITRTKIGLISLRKRLHLKKIVICNSFNMYCIEETSLHACMHVLKYTLILFTTSRLQGLVKMFF